MNGVDNSFAERLFAPSSSIQLASGVLAGSPSFLSAVISTRFQHLLNEFQAAKPSLTGFCGCHLGSSTPVEGRLVEMRSGRARRQLPLGTSSLPTTRLVRVLIGLQHRGLMPMVCRMWPN